MFPLNRYVTLQGREEKCEREAVTVIVIYKPQLHSSQSIFEAAAAAAE